MFCSRCGAEAEQSGHCPVCDQTASRARSSAVGGEDEGTRLPGDEPTQLGSPEAKSPSTTTLRPGQRFGSRYTIIRTLGEGGMGAVHQAWDEALGMAVALKTIRADAAGHTRDLEERFKRELRLARQVTHPNVVRIHDLGELGSTKYITMAYVQGEDLATVLHREEKLPVARALSIAKQIAGGLAAAHEAGVVHRDLKPANVLIDAEQRALLTDFGIARAVDAGTVQTMPGAIVGTLAYMAPEQARGGAADKRSDVYSFGLILYEMLAGGRPGRPGDGALGDLIARLQQGPTSLRIVAPASPAALARVVDRCLQPDPEARYRDAGELSADLDRLRPDGTAAPQAAGTRRGIALLGTAALGIAVAVATWWVGGRRASPDVPAGRPPLSVLIADFENRAGDSVFDGSLEQALGIAIEGAPFITSFPRKAAADRAHELKPGSRLNVDAAQLVALSEGVGVVVAGSIERQQKGYRLQITLFEPGQPEPTKVLEAHAGEKSAVLDATAALAKQIRTALGDTTTPAALQAETYSTSSLEAVHEYSVAQGLTVDSRNEEAVRHYQAAVQLDPLFGRAYAGWAACAYDLGRRAEAEELWKKALSLMDRMTEREKFRTLGGYFMNVARNYDKAIENYRQLVTLYPADLAGRNNLAIAYFYTLDFAKALEEGRRAIDIYPKILKFRANYALYAMYAGDFETAVENATQVLEKNPKYDTAYLPLAIAAAAAGDLPAARAVYERARQAGVISLANAGLADLALYEGRLQEAVAILESAIPLDERDQNTFGVTTKAVALAEALIGLGRTPAALAAANRALALATDESAAVPAARVLAAAGHDDKVARLMGGLASRGQPLPRAYARIIAGELSLRRGRTAEAIEAFSEAVKEADVWLARFGRGVAYVEAARHAEALSELEMCVKRRGEATALFLDDLPTYRYLAVLPYWLGRAQQGLGMTVAARESFEAFLRARHAADASPVASDARSRAAAVAAAPNR